MAERISLFRPDDIPAVDADAATVQVRHGAMRIVIGSSVAMAARSSLAYYEHTNRVPKEDHEPIDYIAGTHLVETTPEGISRAALGAIALCKIAEAATKGDEAAPSRIKMEREANVLSRAAFEATTRLEDISHLHQHDAPTLVTS